jgi:hypothetical protein
MPTNDLGRRIVREVVRNMRTHAERLEYRTLPPRAYDVYLHERDYALVEGLLGEIEQDARRAVAEAIAAENREIPVVDAVRARVGIPRRRFESSGEPEIRILPDAEVHLAEGEIQVDARFPPSSAAASGTPTERVFTTRTGPSGEGGGVSAAAGETRRLLATLSFTDERGPQLFRMEKPSLVVGRGGPGYWVDVKVKTTFDVSREHLRLRHDAATGTFYLKDVSRLGTTLDGVRIPSSMEHVGSAAGKDLDREVPLPSRATIGLAGVLFLEFRAEGSGT